MLYQTPSTQPLINPVIAVVRPAQEPPKPITHTVVENETLTSIAEATQSSVERLWAKNTQIANSDQIKPGDVLTIPTADEKLVERDMISTVPTGTTAPTLASKPSGFSNSGNTYYFGNCVWYLKNIIPWVENGWGNGNDWVYKSGHRVSPIPAVGTIASAKTYNHVALVLSVSKETVHITEMNYQGLGVVSERDASTSEFQYIYP